MIVLDASLLAVAVGDDGADGDRARGLLRLAVEAALPDCADVETAAVLRWRWIAGAMSDDRLAAALAALAALPFPRFPARPFLGRVFELRANVTPYDAVYVALAEALDCDLATADRRLAAATGVRCRVQVVARAGT